MFAHHKDLIVGSLINKGYSISSICPDQLAIECVGNPAALIAFKILCPADTDLSEIRDHLMNYMKNNNILYYSLIIQENYSTATWTLGNINMNKIPNKPKKDYHHNLFVLKNTKGPFSKDPSIEEETPEA